MSWYIQLRVGRSQIFTNGFRWEKCQMKRSPRSYVWASISRNQICPFLLMESYLGLKERHIRANKFGLIQIPCSASLGRSRWRNLWDRQEGKQESLGEKQMAHQTACLQTLWCPVHTEEGFGIVPTTHYPVDALVADPWVREEKKNDRQSCFLH